MPSNSKPSFVPIDEVLQQTNLQQFVDLYGFQSEIKQDGREERIASPVPCDQCRGNKIIVSVNWAKNVFVSHCYHCEFKGKIVKLLYSMKHGVDPGKFVANGSKKF